MLNTFMYLEVIAICGMIGNKEASWMQKAMKVYFSAIPRQAEHFVSQQAHSGYYGIHKRGGQ